MSCQQQQQGEPSPAPISREKQLLTMIATLQQQVSTILL